MPPGDNMPTNKNLTFFPKLEYFLKFYSFAIERYPLKDLFWQVNIKGLIEA